MISDKTVKDKKKLPKYEVISRKLKQAVKDDLYEVGTKMPSQDDLAKEFNVSLLTVRQALGLLESDGVISRERGRGTFVVTKPGQGNGGKVHVRKDTIALVLADMVKVSTYIQNEITELSKMLSDRGWNLMLCSLTIQDIAQGKMPPILEDPRIAGAILDNKVQDIHIEFLRNHNLPLVVFGSCDIESQIAHVNYDQKQAAYLLVKELLERTSGPVCHIYHSLRYHYSHDLLSSYHEACSEAGRAAMVHVTPTESESDYEALCNFLDSLPDDYGLFIHSNIAHLLAEYYRERGVDLTAHPVAIYGAASYVSPMVRKKFNQSTLDIKLGLEVTVNTIEQVIEGKDIGNVSLSPALFKSEGKKSDYFGLKWNLS